MRVENRSRSRLFKPRRFGELRARRRTGFFSKRRTRANDTSGAHVTDRCLRISEFVTMDTLFSRLRANLKSVCELRTNRTLLVFLIVLQDRRTCFREKLLLNTYY